MWPFNGKKKLVQSLGKGREYTKDLVELEQSQHVLLFVCDDMKKGHINQDKLMGFSKKVGRGFTEDHFDFRVGRFTGKCLPFHDRTGLRVKGELHAVESRHIPHLDNHYKNGVEFARVKLNIIITDRHHVLMPIGSEHFIKELPPGMIRTLPEYGVRHYTANEPTTSLIQARMYVAMRVFWPDEDFSLFPPVRPTYPKDELVWLPKYYTYPPERNRCLK